MFSFGVKGGLPLTSTEDSTTAANRGFGGTVNFEMKRYTFGPTVEAKIPFGFRIEIDGLYQHLRSDTIGVFTTSGTLRYQAGTASAWEIPMLVKRRFGHRMFSPYAAAGATLRHIDDFSVNEWVTPLVAGFSPFFNHFTEPAYPSLTAGITAGGGVSFKTRFLRIEPELRYTHWTSNHYLATREQLDFLVGLTFP